MALKFSNFAGVKFCLCIFNYFPKKYKRLRDLLLSEETTRKFVLGFQTVLYEKLQVIMFLSTHPYKSLTSGLNPSFKFGQKRVPFTTFLIATSAPNCSGQFFTFFLNGDKKTCEPVITFL